jgi:hypothetical protein
MMRIFYLSILNGMSAKMVLMPVARKLFLRLNLIAHVFKLGKPTVEYHWTGRLNYQDRRGRVVAMN